MTLELLDDPGIQIAFAKLDKDLKSAVNEMPQREARFIVDSYYQIQDYRMAFGSQARSAQDDEEPHELVQFFGAQMKTFENQIKLILDKWSAQDTLGQWAREQVGIGPVLAAALLAYIDIEKAPYAGNIWSYAGLDPNKKWEKGQKRPWNANLKVVCWKIGESFVKVSNNENSPYGKLYKERKALEAATNDEVMEIPPHLVDTIDVTEDGGANLNAGKGMFKLDGEVHTCYRLENKWYFGGFSKQAQVALIKNIGKDTPTYKAYAKGKLSPDHLHSRAKRYAVKIFLSHYHHVAYMLHYGEEPAEPYAMGVLGHKHYIVVPDLDKYRKAA